MTQSTETRSQPPDASGGGSFGINLDGVLSDDIKAGLPMIIYALWVLVIAALRLTMWNANPDNFYETQISVLIILVLAVGNFFLQVEVNRQRKIQTWIVYAASVIDIVSRLTLWSYCRITFTASGPCRLTTMISQHGGG